MLRLLQSIDQWLRVPTPAERERDYLNGSSDRYDLEFRQRQIDRGLFREYLAPHFR